MKRSALAQSDPFLAAAVGASLQDHVVSKTVRTYNSATENYLRFCKIRRLDPWPVSDVTFCGWLIVLSSTVQVSSMGMYLAGVKYNSGLLGHRWTLDGSDLVRRTMRWLKRRFPSVERAPKLPISVPLVRAMLARLPGWPSIPAMSPADRVFALASVIGVRGYLRGGEFLASPSSSRPVLLDEDVSVCTVAGKQALAIKIRQPKARWWLQNETAYCHASPDDPSFCPVALWNAVRACRTSPPHPTSPALAMPDGQALSSSLMIERTKQLLAAAGVAYVDAHGRRLVVRKASWRAGAVRSALDAHIPDPVIRASGRWRSDAWQSYVLQADYDLQEASAACWAAPALGVGARVGVLDPAGLFTADADNSAVGSVN